MLPEDLYMQAGLEKDREHGNADREVTCAEVNTRRRNQWQSGGERQRTWTSQENQENRNKSGYSRPYDRWDPLVYVKTSKLGAAQICWFSELALYDLNIIY